MQSSFAKALKKKKRISSGCIFIFSCVFLIGSTLYIISIYYMSLAISANIFLTLYLCTVKSYPQLLINTHIQGLVDVSNL